MDGGREDRQPDLLDERRVTNRPVDDGRRRATAQNTSREDVADDARGRHPKRVDADDVARARAFDQDDLRGDPAGDGVMRTLRAAAHQVAAGAGAAHQASTQSQLLQGQEIAHVGVAPAESDEQLTGGSGAHAGEVVADGGQAGLLARSPGEVGHAQISPCSCADGTDPELLRGARQRGNVLRGWRSRCPSCSGRGGWRPGHARRRSAPLVGRSPPDVELRLQPDGVGIAAGFTGVLMDAHDGRAHRLVRFSATGTNRHPTVPPGAGSPRRSHRSRSGSVATGSG